MRMEITQSLKTEQQLKLSPQQILSTKILQLSTVDLEQYLKEKMEENPTLELVEAKGEERDQEDYESEEPKEMGEEVPLEDDFSQLESLSAAYGDYSPSSRSSYSSENDKKMEALQNTAAKPSSLQDQLVDQFHLMDLPENIMKLGEEIIFNIDRDGYFQYDLEDILESMANKGKEYTLEEAEEALRIVQSLEPRGVGGRNLKECLLIQLEDNPLYKFEAKLIENHLEDIQKNSLPKIAKATGEDMELIKEAVDFIRKLDPKPGKIFNAETVQYVQPDVVVEETEDGYDVRIVDSYIPQVHISPRYQRMLQQKGNDPEVRKFVKKKIEAAKWLLQCLTQRNETLERISRAIVDYQEEFLRDGISAIRPLIMQEIADRLEIHVSTVSRAISDKYIQTPQGIFEMSFFFTGKSINEDGEAESTLSIKEKVARIIEEEDKRHPLSDDRISEKLKREEGLSIARRTVTKYRKQMNLPSSRQRKEY